MESVVIAGGIWQRFLIAYLKEKGYKVHVVNPVASETVSFADNWLNADVRAINDIINLLSAQGIKPDFITSDQSEIAITPVAILSERLGLPGNIPEVIKVYTNKMMMYEYAQSLGIPVPRFGSACCVEDIWGFAGLIAPDLKEPDLPIIIKPVESTSSRGFHILTDENIQYCRSYLADCMIYSAAAVMQKFIDGYEITVEGVCSNFEHRTLTTSMKQHFRPGIASSLRYPAYIPEQLLDEITRMNDLFVNSSGLRFGNTHAEYMIDKDGRPWLMEIAARGGGCGIPSSIVPWVTGVDLHEVLLSNLTGKPIDVSKLPVRQRHAVLQFYEFPDGKCDMDQESIADKIKAIPGVDYWHFNFKKHQYLRPATNDQDRHAMAILHGETKQEIDNTLSEIEKVLNEKANHQ